MRTTEEYGRVAIDGALFAMASTYGAAALSGGRWLKAKPRRAVKRRLARARVEARQADHAASTISPELLLRAVLGNSTFRASMWV